METIATRTGAGVGRILNGSNKPPTHDVVKEQERKQRGNVV